jgi:low temperature requirement protein LtrA
MSLRPGGEKVAEASQGSDRWTRSYRRLDGRLMAESRSHLRPRGLDLEQSVTAVELLFDLVFVFAVTQLSHLVLDDPTVKGLLQAAFLLLVVWWGWINTTWLANWLDPASARVRLVLLGGALASLLLAASIPRALENHGLLFAAAYVALQSGRNLAATLLAPPTISCERRSPDFFWSTLAEGLWIAGGLADADHRLMIWGAALAVDLLAPFIGYPTPPLGRSRRPTMTSRAATSPSAVRGS